MQWPLFEDWDVTAGTMYVETMPKCSVVLESGVRLVEAKFFAEVFRAASVHLQFGQRCIMGAKDDDVRRVVTSCQRAISLQAQ